MNQTNELVEDYLSGPSTRKKKEFMDQIDEINKNEIKIKETIEEVEKSIKSIQEMMGNLSYGGRMPLYIERGEMLSDLGQYKKPTPSIWSRFVNSISQIFGK
jgi:hypothetical protein